MLRRLWTGQVERGEAGKFCWDEPGQSSWQEVSVILKDASAKWMFADGGHRTLSVLLKDISL